MSTLIFSVVCLLGVLLVVVSSLVLIVINLLGRLRSLSSRVDDQDQTLQSLSDWLKSTFREGDEQKTHQCSSKPHNLTMFD